MKWNRLALLACLLALVGCPAPVINILPPAEPPTLPALPPVAPPTTPVIPPPAGLTGPVLAALYDGTTVSLWDGTHAVEWKTGAAVRGNGRKIAVGRTLYFLDATGAVTQTMNLPADPAGVSVVGDPVVWTFECITNAEAFALDWTPPVSGGGYTRIWCDGVEAGDWHANGWTYVSSYEIANGDLVAVDNVPPGRFHDVSRPALEFGRIMYAIPGGPLFYLPDFSKPMEIRVYDAAHPGGFTPLWSGPSTWPRLPWTEAGGVWYDGAGDRWDGVTFYSHTTALSAFGGISPPSRQWQQDHGYGWPDWSEAPVAISAYADAGLLYFIECTTGTLWSYDPGTNVVGMVTAQLYDGDGRNATGQAAMLTLEPTAIDGPNGEKTLYFHSGGTLWRRDSASTQISAFSADQQMWVMR